MERTNYGCHKHAKHRDLRTAVRAATLGKHIARMDASCLPLQWIFFPLARAFRIKNASVFWETRLRVAFKRKCVLTFGKNSEFSHLEGRLLAARWRRLSLDQLTATEGTSCPYGMLRPPLTASPPPEPAHFFTILRACSCRGTEIVSLNCGH
jgi:hypothetical protein